MMNATLTIAESQQQWCLGRRFREGDPFVWLVMYPEFVGYGEVFFESAARAQEFAAATGGTLIRPQFRGEKRNDE